jgi:hypothetical protein
VFGVRHLFRILQGVSPHANDLLSSLSSVFQSMNVADTMAGEPSAAAAAVDVVTHDAVACDNCDMCPIIGIRYHCSDPGCFDVDLCEACEALDVHDPSTTSSIPFICFIVHFVCLFSAQSRGYAMPLTVSGLVGE